MFQLRLKNTKRQIKRPVVVRKPTQTVIPTVKVLKKKYNHYLSIDTQVNLNNDDNFNFYVVYYINGLVNNNYLDWLINQILMISNYNSNIYIVATISQDQEDFFRTSVKNLFPNLNINIECYYENEFEYRGILKVWELGQIYNLKNDIILYFHSKGVSHHTSYENNKNDIYNIILKDINIIKEIFSIFPLIDKVGYQSGGIGWIWYNFWFARGSYIYQVEKPVKTDRRHYYEDWLARKVKNEDDRICDYERDITIYENTLANCYGFYTDGRTIANVGTYYNPNIDQYINL